MKLFAGLLTAALFFSNSLNAQKWHNDLVTAQEQAQIKGHNILLVFSGSDWCAPCIKLDKEVWSTEEFQELAEGHFVMLKADFPRKKQNKLSDTQQQKNNQLAEKYNQQGNFPLVVLLDQQGSVLGITGYKRVSPQEYFHHLTSFEP